MGKIFYNCISHEFLQTHNDFRKVCNVFIFFVLISVETYFFVPRVGYWQDRNNLGVRAMVTDIRIRQARNIVATSCTVFLLTPVVILHRQPRSITDISIFDKVPNITVYRHLRVSLTSHRRCLLWTMDLFSWYGGAPFPTCHLWWQHHSLAHRFNNLAQVAVVQLVV